jgi:hypothetical protein
MAALRHFLAAALLAALLLTAALVLWSTVRGHPQDLPWTPLDLSQPVGAFTGRKLAALGSDTPACHALLRAAGVRYIPLAPLNEGPSCGYDNAVRLLPGGARRIGFSPAEVGMSCPVAAALAMWEWNVVQPEAQQLLGQPVLRFEHFGSYNCRRIAGRDARFWSQHSHANALDIAGVVLADGSRVTVAGDWRDPGPKGTFLRRIRNGACRLFATTLSPDYNAAHHDHLHLDEQQRGMMGWRACR